MVVVLGKWNTEKYIHMLTQQQGTDPTKIEVTTTMEDRYLAAVVGMKVFNRQTFKHALTPKQ